MCQFKFFRVLPILFILVVSPLKGSALTAQQVYEKVKDSVFTLYSLDFKTKQAKARGSAVAITKNILATNCHIALAGNYLLVKSDDKARVARLFYQDPKQDLCLLEIPGANFSPAKIRNSQSVKIGESVFAIGNPQGTEKSLSQGIISNLHKVDGGMWLQTDAVIYFGSSGGGLFDQDGDLIGITAKMGGNFGFAIPTQWILDVLQPQSGTAQASSSQDSSGSQLSTVVPEQKIDYSQAAANLKLLGTYGRDQVALYRNNKACFISFPGHGSKDRRVGVSIWNPQYPEKVVVFASAISMEAALELLLRSIVEGKVKAHSNYLSENKLYLGGKSYHLYGASSDFERYAYFVARFENNPIPILEKTAEFSVQFNDLDSRIGNDKVTFRLDGFEDAYSAYKKECQ